MMTNPISPSSSCGSLEPALQDENDQQHTVRVQQRKDYYIATRKALLKMEESIHRVLTYLASEGLSQASLNQFSGSLRDGQHIVVMTSAQEYMRHISQCNATTDTLDLFIRAWSAVSAYLEVLYRQAHCNYMHLRRSHKISMLAGALQKKMQLGELCCHAQKEGLILERVKKQRVWKEQQQQRVIQSADLSAAQC